MTTCEHTGLASGCCSCPPCTASLLARHSPLSAERIAEIENLPTPDHNAATEGGHIDVSLLPVPEELPRRDAPLPRRGILTASGVSA